MTPDLIRFSAPEIVFQILNPDPVRFWYLLASSVFLGFLLRVQAVQLSSFIKASAFEFVKCLFRFPYVCLAGKAGSGGNAGGKGRKYRCKLRWPCRLVFPIRMREHDK